MARMQVTPHAGVDQDLDLVSADSATEADIELALQEETALDTELEAEQILEEAAGTLKSSQRLRRGIILTILGGTLWGLNGTLLKVLLVDFSIDPLWLACFRQLTACWLFLITAQLLTPQKLHLAIRQPRTWLTMLSVALFSILMSQISYLMTINWTNSATATVLQSLGVVLVMAYVCLRDKRRPRKRELFGVLCACIGTFLVATGGNIGSLALPIQGLIWGGICALASAILSIQPLESIRRFGNFTTNGLAFLIAGLVMLPFSHPISAAPSLDVHGWLMLALSVVIGTFGAYSLFLQGVKEVGSIRGSMLASAEPVAATISAYLVTAASFSVPELTGFVLIIAVIFLTA